VFSVFTAVQYQRNFSVT